MDKLMMFLAEKDGKLSNMRLLVTLIVVVYVCVWATLSIKNGAMYPVDLEQAIIVVGALIAKAAQTSRSDK